MCGNNAGNSYSFPGEPAALVIAGSDSCGGAGLQADMTVLRSMGVDVFSAVTAVTAQSPQCVSGIWEMDAAAVTAQVDSSLESCRIKAVKTGMLCSARVVEAVIFCLEKPGRELPLIIDPVVFASDGTELLDKKGVDLLKNRLLPMASVIAPNAAEAGILTGCRIESEEDIVRAAKQLVKNGAQSALITTGDMPGDPEDVFVCGERVVKYRKKRISGSFHGSGCKLTSAITGFVCKGFQIEHAVEKAEEIISDLLTG